MTHDVKRKRNKKLYNYGVSLRAPRSDSDSFLGPSSLYYFTTRLVRPLGSADFSSASQPSIHADSLVPRYEDHEKPVREAYASDTENGIQEKSATKETDKISDPRPGEWNAMQEQYFTDRYWESVHTSILPILDEAEFKAHHQSLWTSTGGSRKPSALVDTVIALCMQLGVPSVSRGETERSNPPEIDVTLAGQRYYRRAQALLAYEMENPSLTTLQCYLLGALYVCAASFHNMVDITLAKAVRTAYILGLHLDPPATLSRKEKDKRRRLWWATYQLETKISAKLGRPFGIDDSFRMPELPSDDAEAAMLAGSMFAPIGPNETWLSFNKYNIMLYKNVREGHSTFFATCAALAGDQNIWRDPEILEACAESLIPHLESLNQWRDSVPACLRTRRRGGGAALSVDGTTVEVEVFAPIWLQRQCLLLELTYHHLSINLFRPLISFAAAPKPDSTAVKLADQCALHAIAYTKILHHVLTTTKILESWNETFHWQWNAVLTLVGFILARPAGSATQLATDARSAINLATEVCEIYAKSFSVATQAAKSIRELTHRVDSVLSQRLETTMVGDVASTSQVDEAVQAVRIDEAMAGAIFLDPPMTGEDCVIADNEGLYDMVMGVDFWHDMDVWWPNMSLQMVEVVGRTEAGQTLQS